MSRYKWKCILKGMLCTPLLPCSLHHAICNSTGSPSYHKTLDHIQSTFFPSYLVASPSFQTASPPFCFFMFPLPSIPSTSCSLFCSPIFVPSFLPSIYSSCLCSFCRSLTSFLESFLSCHPSSLFSFHHGFSAFYSFHPGIGLSLPHSPFLP